MQLAIIFFFQVATCSIDAEVGGYSTRIVKTKRSLSFLLTTDRRLSSVKEKEMRVLDLLAVAIITAALCERAMISAQAQKALGYCHCNTSGIAGQNIVGCNTSGICTIPGGDPSLIRFLGCIVDYAPRYDRSNIVDIYFRCLVDNIDYGFMCNPGGSISSQLGIDDPSVVVKETRSGFSICCVDSLCNTEEMFREVHTLYRRAQTTPTTTTTTSSSTPATQTTTVMLDDKAITLKEVPLYAVIAIPILSVLVIVILGGVAIGLCLHFCVNPHRIGSYSHHHHNNNSSNSNNRGRKGSNSSGAPTVTSNDLSSYDGEHSTNNDYSGSGAGKPLLTHISIAGQISLHELIGKGRYGEVWKGLYKCDEVAVKIFKTVDETSWTHEVNIYKTCLFRHPNILRFIASDSRDVGFQIELWLITEFCEFGSLYDLLVQQSVEPATMLQLAYTACCGLDHLHTEIFGQEAKQAIVHRDLKSRNILVKAGFNCCIGDLGLALRYNRAIDQMEDPPTKRVGTKRYLAPEIIDESISLRHFDSFKKADIYSFGLILWEIGMKGEVDGVAEEYQMPYQNLVPTDPSFEDMRKTVVVEKRRPTLPNRWTQSELFRSMSKLIQQCWLHESDARLTSLRVKKSLYNLQKSYISEEKRHKEQSA